MNKCSFTGRLTADPELRSTQSGSTVANFTIAVDRRFTPKGQEKQTDFIDCVAWNATGDFVQKYFNKGQQILVHGSFQSRRWTDKNNNKRTSWELIVNEVEFFGSKQSDTTSTPRDYGESALKDNDFTDAEFGDDPPF